MTHARRDWLPALGAALGLMASGAGAAQETYVIDPTHTFPSFEINHYGFSTHRGRFNDTTGKITLDLETRTGRIDVTIQSASIDTGSARLENHLKAEDFLSTARWPTMRFTADRLRFEGDLLVGADGQFTMLGETRPLSLSVRNFRCAPHPLFRKPHCGADVSGTLKRSDYGMVKFVPALGDEVRLLIQVEATLE